MADFSVLEIVGEYAKTSCTIGANSRRGLVLNLQRAASCRKVKPSAQLQEKKCLKLILANGGSFSAWAE
jgi:hypothetical protein